MHKYWARKYYCYSWILIGLVVFLAGVVCGVCASYHTSIFFFLASAIYIYFGVALVLNPVLVINDGGLDYNDRRLRNYKLRFSDICDYSVNYKFFTLYTLSGKNKIDLRFFSSEDREDIKIKIASLALNDM